MEKLDKVIAGMECHRGLGERQCESDCPYFKGYYQDDCFDDLRSDALWLIKHLERQLKYARAERDAAHARIARIIGEREKVWLDEK